MKNYIAFLRGINISGKNKLPMADLKELFSSLGFFDVNTFLNSGNVIFSAENIDIVKIRKDIECRIHDQFGFTIPVYVIEREELEDIVDNRPEWWNTGDKSKYDNLIFILTDEEAKDIAFELGEPSVDLEQYKLYKNVIFWTFDRTKYQKCNWWKNTAGVGVSDKLTIRTANTVFKVLK